MSCFDDNLLVDDYGFIAPAIFHGIIADLHSLVRSDSLRKGQECDDQYNYNNEQGFYFYEQPPRETDINLMILTNNTLLLPFFLFPIGVR